MNKTLNYIIYVIVGGLIVLNVVRVLNLELTDDAPSDYRSLFVGGKYMFDNTPLFDTSACMERWGEIIIDEKLKSSSAPGQIHISALTYPPHAYPVFTFNKFLSWKQGRIVWWAVCICSFGFLLFWLKSRLLIGLALGFKGSVFAIFLGQPMLLVAALLAMVIRFYRSKSPLFSAGLVLLALIKFTLVVPLIIWLTVNKRWKILLISGFLVSVNYGLLLFAFPSVISDYFMSADGYYNFIYSDHPSNLYPTLNSELTSMINAFVSLPSTAVKVINILGQLVGFGWCIYLFCQRKIDGAWLLYLLYLVSFLFSYHLIYDALILLIPIGLIHVNQSNRSYIYLIPFVLLSMPWNALSGYIPLLEYHFPLILIGAFCLALVINKKVATIE